MSEYLWKSLRPSRYGEGVDVVGFREETDGVLAGQTIRHFIAGYATEAEARQAHPDADGWSSDMTDPQPNFNHLPGEDDPVAGGMYPDDWDGCDDSY